VHIYFDDRTAQIEAASRLVLAGRVPESPSPQPARGCEGALTP